MRLLSVIRIERLVLAKDYKNNTLRIKYLTPKQIVYEEKLPCFILLSLMFI